MHEPRVLTALRMEKTGPRTFCLVEDLLFYSARHRGLIMAPAGMASDGASVPRPLWWLVPPSGQYDYGVVFHDGAYRGTLVNGDGDAMHFIRALADALLDEVNEATGVAGWERAVLYRGVRLGGALAYQRAQAARRAAFAQAMYTGDTNG